MWYRIMGRPHRNIISFFGYVTDDPRGLGLVSSQFSSGSATRYIGQNTTADREYLVSVLPPRIIHLLDL